MVRKIAVILLTLSLGLSAELWVNAIRDPGAELGAGDWDTEIWEKPGFPGSGDSAIVGTHDSSRSYEDGFSFLTDTKKDPQMGAAECHVYCFQALKVPKAVADIDSCFWVIDLEDTDDQWLAEFSILFRSQNERNIRWAAGNIFTTTPNDTLYTIEFPVPDSGVWTEYGGNLYNKWTSAAGWHTLDTIVEIQLQSWGVWGGAWAGQEVSWDNIVLRSIAYYDYAAESIDSDPWDEVPRSYTPIATFANKGKLDEHSAWVFAEIYRHDNLEVVFKDSVEVSIPSENSQQVTFAQYDHDGGSAGYSLRVFPLLENDELSTDDTLELELMAYITEQPNAERLLTTRRIDAGVLFSFASGMCGNLYIYDVSGREVYSTSIVPGTQELIWSTNEVSSGLYFYRFNSEGLSVTNKLIVLH